MKEKEANNPRRNGLLSPEFQEGGRAKERGTISSPYQKKPVQTQSSSSN